MSSYSDALEDTNTLRPFLHKFLLLQSLHERAASSHDRYDLLSSDPENRELLEGLGQLLVQISLACHEVSKSLVMGTIYQHPVSLKWTISALHNQIEEKKLKGKSNNLSLLLQNLNQSHLSLQNMNYNVDSGLLPRVGRDSRSIWERLNEQLSWHHVRIRYAIRLSTCFLLGYILIQYFKIVQGDWIILTSLFVCQPSYSETRKRLFQRILGTLSGVIAGVLLLQLLPTTSGQVLLILLSSYAFFVWYRKKYSISVIFITIFVMAAFNLVAGKGLAIMGPRILDTLIGALLAIGVVRFLWPDWQYKRLPQLLSNALEKNKSYFSSILEEYQIHEEDDLNYRTARYQAHQADNALTLAWQGMQLEPKKQQKFQKRAFALTYLNHALLSYLSALGAHRDDPSYISDEHQKFYQQIEKELSKTISLLKNNKPYNQSQGLTLFLEQLSHKLSLTDKGVERQKLVLLYNIAEVNIKLLRETSLITQD